MQKILWGNADVFEKKGVAKKATQKMLKLKGLQIDCSRNAVRVGEGRRDQTGTRQQNRAHYIPHPLLFVK